MRFGSCAIIPPLPEKELPEQFAHIWREATQSLSDCEEWIVCGYSLRDFDEALIGFFTRCAARRGTLRIRVSSPSSASLVDRWRAVAPQAQIEALPGIPEAIPFL